MKYVTVILPMVFTALSSQAVKLEHVPMDKMNFDQQAQSRNYKDWIVTKIPGKNKNSILNYRLDIKIAQIDRKKFNLYNFRFFGDPATPYHAGKTYKAENFIPNFLVGKGVPKTNKRIPETSTLSNTAHWMEWRSGNQKNYLKDSLALSVTEVSPQLFERLLEEFTLEVDSNSLKTGDFVVVYGTDDIDQIQMPVASYIYMGNGIVLESKKLKFQSVSKFVYLKDVQTHFKNRMVDYRMRNFRTLTKKPLYLSEYVNDSKEHDLNLDRHAAKNSNEIL